MTIIEYSDTPVMQHSLRVYMIRNEFSPSHYTDLPFEVESGFIHSALNHIFQDFFR